MAALQRQIKAWADQEPGWAFTAHEEREIKEAALGEYSVTVWKIQAPDGEVRLEPIARNHPERGIVEIHAWPTLRRVHLLPGGSDSDWRVRVDSGHNRMSDLYIQRLRGVQTEIAAARAALIYIERSWQRQDIYPDIAVLTPEDFVQAARRAEATYFIRLYAEAEGILKDHLATNHPQVPVPDKPQVDWLISRVIQLEGMTLVPPLRRRRDAVRDYRNLIAHRHARPAALVLFDDGLSVLNAFLARLPKPIT